MSRYVDLDERVTAQFYDEQYEEWTQQTVTIEDVLDSVCDEYTVLPSAQFEKRTETNACDYISRQAAIDAFDGTKVDEENCTEYDIGYNDGIDFAVSKLSVLPSARPEQRWIPVSERLPEECIKVLTQHDDEEMEINYIICGDEWFYDGVVAWQPLPEPHKEAKEEK